MAAENMQRKDRGLEAALLCVCLILLLLLEGCGARRDTYMAGVKHPQRTALTEADTHTSDGQSADGMQERTETTAGVQEPAGYIHVCGAVRQPGVYPYREGMRVFEAVELAGGFDGDADEQWLNQADLVQDGQRLYVYTKEETSQMGLPAETAGQSAQEQKVNINTADREALMTLPGIGEAKADAVLSYRSEHGRFTRVEELLEIPGIKDAVFSKIKDRITVQ